MNEILHIINQMSPYLLLGFLIAGVMHAFIPTVFYQKHFSQPNFGSVLKAALFGIPLPLCSCGVIPTAMSLRNEGASKGAVTSFLIATPQTGIDSILATYGLLGLPFAIVRPIAALVTALVGGSMSNMLSGNDEEQSCKNCSVEEKSQMTLAQRLVLVIRYAYLDMIQSIGKWLMVGLIVAGLITIFVPQNWFSVFEGNTLLSMLVVLAISIPMYLCATGSIPIAVALIMKGLTPGAALVLLMAGPACNMASVLVVKSVMGTRSLIIYLAAVVIGAIGFGCLVDYLHFNEIVSFTGTLSCSGACCHACQTDGWFAWTCTVLLGMMIINAFAFGKYWNKNTATKTMNGKTYLIEGMDCPHCRAAAEKALQGVEGVTNANVVLETKEAYIEGTASEEDLRKAIESVGFSLKTK
ncbi:MAG: SO_0444 family Cu/Zn efflux transporter [Bacteroidales bacterium]|nr:SO_0444 family Cu/Zn efflux transporter [Bacteroidales bacterium]